MSVRLARVGLRCTRLDLDADEDGAGRPAAPFFLHTLRFLYGFIAAAPTGGNLIRCSVSGGRSAGGGGRGVNP